MSRSVLLVDPDVDALGTVASRLRSLGLTVVLADTADSALDRVHNVRLDAVLVSDALADLPVALERLRSDRTVGRIAIFLLVDVDDERPSAAFGIEPWETLARDDVDGIAKRLYALSSRPPPSVAMRDDIRGDLQQVSVLDLLQLLSMNQRTGAVTITTPTGAGEVRLAHGNVVDAVFRRLEAEKALFRLLGERDGSFVFAAGSEPPPIRIEMPTNVLLMEGLRQLDEARSLREQLALDDEALVATTLPVPDDSDPTQRVLLALGVPRTLDELLDEIPLADNVILSAAKSLLGSGDVRRVPKGSLRTVLGDPEQLTVLGALANRLRAAGYPGPARLLFAAQPRRLATVTHALRRIADAVPPPDAHRSLPVPDVLVTLRLVEGAELDIVGLPTVEAYAPLWELALPGSAGVLQLEPPPSNLLADLCAVGGIPLLNASVLVGEFDEADPAQLAALVRSALDALAGG